MKKVLLALLLSLSGLSTVANAATHVITTAQSTATIQSTITGSAVGDIISFSAGTYALTAPLTLKCGLSYTGPVATPATVIITSAGTGASTGAFNLYSNSDLSNPCTQATSIQYFNFKSNTTGIFVQTSFTNLTVANNQFTNIPGSTNQTAGMVVQSGTTTSNTASTLSNTTFTRNQFGDSNSCISPTNVMTDTHSPEDYEGACNGIVFFTSINGLTLTYNNFLHVAEGVHINCPGYVQVGQSKGGVLQQFSVCEPPGGAITQNMVAEFNDFSQIHRITWEQQPQQTGNMLWKFNSEHDWVNPYFGSFGLSMACCYNGTVSQPNLDASSNVVIFNTAPAGRYGYGMEAMGALAHYDNELLEAVASSSNAGGLAYGRGPVYSMANNTVLGNFEGNGSHYIETEGFPSGAGKDDVPIVFTGNVTGPTVQAFASAPPTISPALGTQTFPMTITVTDVGFTSGSLPLGNTGIWYTTDGSTPVPGSGTALRLDSGGTFVLNSAATVKAVGMWGAANQPTNYPTGYGFTPSTVISAAFAGGTTPTITSGYLSTIPTNGVNTGFVGDTIQFAPIANYNNGANNVVIAASTCTWDTTDHTVITVASSGLVTAVGAGVANVQASCAGIAFSYWTVTTKTVPVTGPTLAGISVSPGAAYVTQLIKLAALGTFSDGTVGAPTVSWASSNEDVATVDQSGNVTPVGWGTSNVTANSGSISAQALIVVPPGVLFGNPVRTQVFPFANSYFGCCNFQRLPVGVFTLTVNTDGSFTVVPQ